MNSRRKKIAEIYNKAKGGGVGKSFNYIANLDANQKAVYKRLKSNEFNDNNRFYTLGGRSIMSSTEYPHIIFIRGIEDLYFTKTKDAEEYLQTYEKGGSVGVEWDKDSDSIRTELGEFKVRITPQTQKGYYDVYVSAYKKEIGKQHDVYGLDKAKDIALEMIGNANKMEKGGSVKGKYEVELEASPNPDYSNNRRDNRGSVKIKPVRVKVSSFAEASKICQKYIDDNDLGGGNWTGGAIYEDGKQIAYVSYNGRIWEGKEWNARGKELFEKGGGVGEGKSEKWYNRLRTYEREHLSKKYPIEKNETIDKWIERVWIESGKSIGVKRETKLEQGGSVSEDVKFNCMMLSRLQSDCDYYLGNGKRSERVLWAGNVDDHIAEMKRLWNNLKVKPEWLSMEEIEDYEKQMKNEFEKGGEIEGSNVGIAKRTKVKNWYIKNYPTDDLGKGIDDKITFWSLYTMMSQGYNVYSLLEVSDSLVRERVFEKLSTILGIEYNIIYDKWLKGSKMEQGGPIPSIEPYDEDKYTDQRAYLKELITNIFGKENSYSGSADWGGIPVWTVKGDKYQGTFIIIDDNGSLVLMKREITEEEHIDEDLMTAEWDNVEDITALLNKAKSIKGEIDLDDLIIINNLPYEVIWVNPKEKRVKVKNFSSGDVKEISFDEYNKYLEQPESTIKEEKKMNKKNTQKGIKTKEFAHDISNKSVEDIAWLMEACEMNDAALDFNDKETIAYFDPNELNPFNKKKAEEIFGKKMEKGGSVGELRLVVGHRYVLNRHNELSIGEFVPSNLEKYWNVFLDEIINDEYVKVSGFLDKKYFKIVVKKSSLLPYKQPIEDDLGINKMEKGGGINSPIKKEDIVKNSRFKTHDGTIFIVDEVKPDDDFGTLVETSLEGGAKGNYRNSLEDLVDFFNEEKCVRIDKMENGGKIYNYEGRHVEVRPKGKRSTKFIIWDVKSDQIFANETFDSRKDGEDFVVENKMVLSKSKTDLVHKIYILSETISGEGYSEPTFSVYRTNDEAKTAIEQRVLDLVGEGYIISKQTDNDVSLQNSDDEDDEDVDYTRLKIFEVPGGEHRTLIEYTEPNEVAVTTYKTYKEAKSEMDKRAKKEKWEDEEEVEDNTTDLQIGGHAYDGYVWFQILCENDAKAGHSKYEKGGKVGKNYWLDNLPYETAKKFAKQLSDKVNKNVFIYYYKHGDSYAIDTEPLSKDKKHYELKEVFERSKYENGGSVDEKISVAFYKWGEYEEDQEIDAVDLPVRKLTSDELDGFNIRDEDENKFFYAEENDIDEDDDGVSVKRAFATVKEYANGGSIYAGLSEKDFANKIFGANVFSEDISQYFDVKQLSSSKDDKIDKFISDLKSDGYYVKKKAYSDFTSVLGVKKKNKMESGGSIDDFTEDESGNYKNAQGYQLINQLDETYQVLDPEGTDISGEYETLEQGMQTIMDYMSTIGGNEKMENGGSISELKKGDFIYEEGNRTRLVTGVTNDEYIIKIHGDPDSDVPFSKKKVEEYFSTGKWSLKPKEKKRLNIEDYKEYSAEDGRIRKDGKIVGHYDFDRDSNAFWMSDRNAPTGQKAFNEKVDMYDYVKNNPEERKQNYNLDGEYYEKGGRIKGVNRSTGETFGVVIGSQKKSDEYVKNGTEISVRKSYGSRISEVKIIFDADNNLHSIIDYGYSLNGYPNTSSGGSGTNYNATKKETIKILSEMYSPSFAKNILENVSNEFEKGGKVGKEYMVFNYTDNIYATDETFTSLKSANDFIKQFRKRYENQGYYRDSQMNKINIKDIDLLVIPGDFNPFKKMAMGGSVIDRKESLLRYVMNDMPEGTIENITGISDPKTIDSIHNGMISFLQRHGDRRYAETTLKNLIKDAQVSVVGRPAMAYAKGGEVVKFKIPQTEKEKREVYKLAFGKEYDSKDRKQMPLPIDMATTVAMRKLETDNGYEFYAKGGEVDTVADRYARLTKTEAKRLDELSKKVRINEQTEAEDAEWNKLVHKYRGWEYKDGGGVGNIDSDIQKAKTSLIKKAKSKGLYESFGQKEVRELQDKYGYNPKVNQFDDWVMDFDLNQVSQYEKGGSIGNNEISKEDVLQVAKALKMTPNDKQIEAVIKQYPSAAEEDTEATWDLIVENLLYQEIDNQYYFDRKITKNNIDPELENFDIDNLDAFEIREYNKFLPSLGKVEALQLLINNVEGDYTQLSPELSELAEKQISTDEWDRISSEMNGFKDGGSIDEKLYYVVGKKKGQLVDVSTDSKGEITPFTKEDAKIFAKSMESNYDYNSIEILPYRGKNQRVKMEQGGPITGNPYSFNVSANRPNGDIVNQVRVAYAENIQLAEEKIRTHLSDKLGYKHVKIFNGREGHEGITRLEALGYKDGGSVSKKHIVGTFNEAELRKGDDKVAIEKAQKETGLKYVGNKIVKKGGKTLMEVYLMTDEEYLNSNKFEDGGSVEAQTWTIRDNDDIAVGSYLDEAKLISWAKQLAKENGENIEINSSKEAIAYIEKRDEKGEQDFEVYDDYANGGSVSKRGGNFNVGDKVMVDDSGYITSFHGFDLSKPATILSKHKVKTSQGVKYTYGLELADGRKPFNSAMENKLTLANIMEQGEKIDRSINLDPKANLRKELNSLQRDLNSQRLGTYTEGDNSKEAVSRKKERETKLNRFNEVLKLLRENETIITTKNNTMSKETQEKIEKLKKGINNSNVSDKHKEMMKKQLAELEKEASSVPAPVKKSAPKQVVAKTPAKVTVSNASEEDCAELIAQRKKAKKAAKERAAGPQKTPATKNKEKIEKVEDNLTKRIKSGDVSQEELKKLKKEAQDLISLIDKYLK